MNQFQTVILPSLKNRFEINDLQGAYQQNVWIMALAILPYNEELVASLPEDGEPPTHTVASSFEQPTSLERTSTLTVRTFT